LHSGHIANIFVLSSEEREIQEEEEKKSQKQFEKYLEEHMDEIEEQDR